MSAYAASGLPLDRMMVGTGAAALADAVALTGHAAELGFAGALVLPPFYYKGVPDDGLFAAIEAIVSATAAQPIPIYLYHFPAQSGLPWHVALIRRLLDSFGERIAGLKDSSGDMDFARAAAGISPRFAVFPSTEAALPQARAGRFRRLHLGDRQSQCRSLRPRLSLRRCRGARASGRHPQAVRRQAAGRRRQGAARAYSWRAAMGPRGAAAVAASRGRPRGRHRRLRGGARQARGMRAVGAAVPASRTLQPARGALSGARGAPISRASFHKSVLPVWPIQNPPRRPHAKSRAAP